MKSRKWNKVPRVRPISRAEKSAMAFVEKVAKKFQLK